MGSNVVAQVHGDAGPPLSLIGVRLTLTSAVSMALTHNRHLLLAHDAVRESIEQKRIAESHLYPILKNQSAVLHITQLEGITVPAGSLAASGPISPLPQTNLVIAQGSDTAYTSGTELVQPLTQVFRIRAGVKAADAELRTARIQEADADNGVVLQVHQLYLGLLIEQVRSEAAQAAFDASTIAEQETRRNFEEGRLLEDVELASQTDMLDKRQAILVAHLNIDDLTLRLDDVVGLPIGTKLVLDGDTAGPAPNLPTRAEAMALAIRQSPTVSTAMQGVEKAKAGLTSARDAYIPEIAAIARYSYQSGVPFLSHNFGTFGATISYDLFNGGAREASLREARIRLSMAETQLEQAKNDVQIEISAAYDKAEQLEQLVSVVTRALTARSESLRIQTKRAEADAELASGVARSRAALASARVNVLNSRLTLSLAQSNIKRLLARAPVIIKW